MYTLSHGCVFKLAPGWRCGGGGVRVHPPVHGGLLGQQQYLMLTSVALTFRIFIGMAEPVPRKTISGYCVLFSVENTR